MNLALHTLLGFPIHVVPTKNKNEKEAIPSQPSAAMMEATFNAQDLISVL
jgi:hypothetical protein